jgi:chromosome partitioning protein
MLSQEIARVGGDCDVVVIDAPGHDSAIARRAIAMADTLVTPVNGSFADIDVLGQFNALTRKFVTPGCFAAMVDGIRTERERIGMAPLDWLVIQNRARRGISHCQTEFEAAMAQLSSKLGFRTGAGLPERVAYRELLLLGLTHLDLRHIHSLPSSRSVAREEVLRLRDDVELLATSALVYDENQLELI